MKKGCLIAAGAFVAFAAAIVAIALFATSGVTKEADAFFTLLRDGKVAEAYQATSPAFKRETDAAGFEHFVKRNALDQVASWSWTQRNIQNDAGKVGGQVALKGGASMPAEVELVHEGGAWKVQGIQCTPPAGVVKKESAPEEAELKRLVRSTLLDFNDAVKAKDFKKFHATLAAPFREQFTAEKLAESFQSFVDKQLDISPIATLEPTFEGAPQVDENEVMTVIGSYPTTPVQVHFRLKYHFEGQWKALGVNVELK